MAEGNKKKSASKYPGHSEIVFLDDNRNTLLMYPKKMIIEIVIVFPRSSGPLGKEGGQLPPLPFTKFLIP